MSAFYVMLNPIHFIYSFMGGVIGYLIGKYWDKK